jgi:predicted alpha/beta hydrolase family esterase
MKKPVLFIQGGGDDGYEADLLLVNSLQTSLGKGFLIHYPEIVSNESLPDFGWPQEIGTYISQYHDGIILVGHSLGASMLLKYLSENNVTNKIAGIFLIATPFWGGDKDWQAGLALHKDFVEKLDKEVPIYFYQCEDDEVVPIAHLAFYRKAITWATFRELKTGGHQLDNDLTIVAGDIKAL